MRYGFAFLLCCASLLLVLTLPCLGQAAFFQSADTPQVTLTFPEQVYVDMPIWVTLHFPPNLAGLQGNLRYPFTSDPAFCWGHRFEVLCDKVPLSPRQTKLHFPICQTGLLGGSCAPPSSPSGRVPLHIFFRFDKPARYYVRYVLDRDYLFGNRHEQVAQPPITSEWTPLDVVACSPEQRTAWQQQELAHPPDDDGLLVGDYLPSLLASPDETVLPAFMTALHHRNPLLRQYALQALGYFPAKALQRATLRELQDNGPSGTLADLLAAAPAIFQPQAEEYVKLLLPALDQHDAARTGFALQALTALAAFYNWKEHPGIPARIESAVLAATPRLLATHDEQVLQPLCGFLRLLNIEQSRTLLWQLADDPGLREQAFIFLCQLGDQRDFPLLGKTLRTGGNITALPHALHQAYGDLALIFLVDTLQHGADHHICAACALELAEANRLEGYRYLQEILAHPDDEQAYVIANLRTLFHQQKADINTLRSLVETHIK